MQKGFVLVISNPDRYKGEPFSRALDAGARLIVVDPRLTRAAARADIWLQIRPGTDTALALGKACVIVQEGLYDREFVAHYVYGWDAFVARAVKCNLCHHRLDQGLLPACADNICPAHAITSSL